VLTTATASRPRVGRFLAKWVALPLSALPFFAYGTMTPEGRLVRDRAVVSVAPPSLPKLSAREKATIAAVAPRYDGAVMTLAYHGIGSSSDGEGGFVVSPKRFGEHLVALRAGGMNVVTASDLDRAFHGGPPLPANAVMLTFDDGRSDAMLFADPLLKQARMKATMFVITDAAERSGVYYAPWKRLKGYARSGRWDIQSHTASSHREHRAAGGAQLPALTSLERGESLAEYRDRIRADLAEAATEIEKNVGTRPVAFAYPFGAYGAERTNDPAIRDILREEVGRHYTLAFHQDDQEQIPLVTADADRLGLRRLEVEGWSGPLLLQHIADAARRSGFGPPSSASDSYVGGDVPMGDLGELTLGAPQPVAAADASPPGGAPPPSAEPVGPAAPAGPAATGGDAGAGAPDSGSAPTPVSPVTLGPASGPTPTTAIRPPVMTMPPTTSPPATTSPPTTRPPSTTTPTTRTPPTTVPLDCPDKGKPKPGCPPRGNS
jgi:peptidoglycan/xylan/chitin deacetylase (PgdA/CDA1 family)